MDPRHRSKLQEEVLEHLLADLDNHSNKEARLGKRIITHKPAVVDYSDRSRIREDYLDNKISKIITHQEEDCLAAQQSRRVAVCSVNNNNNRQLAAAVCLVPRSKRPRPVRAGVCLVNNRKHPGLVNNRKRLVLVSKEVAAGYSVRNLRERPPAVVCLVALRNNLIWVAVDCLVTSLQRLREEARLEPPQTVAEACSVLNQQVLPLPEVDCLEVNHNNNRIQPAEAVFSAELAVVLVEVLL